MSRGGRRIMGKTGVKLRRAWLGGPGCEAPRPFENFSEKHWKKHQKMWIFTNFGRQKWPFREPNIIILIFLYKFSYFPSWFIVFHLIFPFLLRIFFLFFPSLGPKVGGGNSPPPTSPWVCQWYLCIFNFSLWIILKHHFVRKC